MEPIRILLVDDHEVVRTGLRMLIQDEADILILGEASTGEEAIALTRELQPEVVVMDLTLPDISGIDITRTLKNETPQVAVVALTIHEDQQYFFEMLKAGATGYVPKRAAPEDLISAIRAAHSGEVYLYPSLARTLVEDFIHRASQEARPSVLENLTHREKEVLGYLAEGLTNEEIANKLLISKHTVARHRENLMRKLNLHSRSDLVRYAVRKGVIQP
ncbi:MAG: response regulator transcription factor [Anaerolineales bacterium]|nr:response regulator transcription factor [Anaerolineales bacterium]